MGTMNSKKPISILAIPDLPPRNMALEREGLGRAFQLYLEQKYPDLTFTLIADEALEARLNAQMDAIPGNGPFAHCQTCHKVWRHDPDNWRCPNGCAPA